MYSPSDLPTIRRGERADYYRCPKKWYWAWRKGLVPRAKQFGALDLGAWMHTALATWYGQGRKRVGTLKMHFYQAATNAIAVAVQSGAPDHIIEKAEELLSLGEAMAQAYEKHYGSDSDVDVITAEIPLEFTIPDHRGNILAIHKLKPDLVFRLRSRRRRIWLMEHKTARTIRTAHLVIDNQARPYGTMAERALRKLGVISRDEEVEGILYNFLRKGLPDLRPTDGNGRSLNKDGSVSKRQPAPLFIRKPVTMTRQAKIITLSRLQADAIMLTSVTMQLRNGHIDPIDIPKVPRYDCPDDCQFFDMCVAEENGTDIRTMERSLYIRRNPYLYEEETTEDAG